MCVCDRERERERSDTKVGCAWGSCFTSMVHLRLTLREHNERERGGGGTGKDRQTDGERGRDRG